MTDGSRSLRRWAREGGYAKVGTRRRWLVHKTHPALQTGNYLAYPRTLIRENDSTARDEIGRPIDIAGRNVVKISILFTCGNSS